MEKAELARMLREAIEEARTFCAGRDVGPDAIVEIERRRAEWRADLKSSNILFVQQYERVAEYSRYARIEARRKRYKAAREHMHEIALETSDLG